jgi:P-type Cu2+ transporter
MHAAHTLRDTPLQSFLPAPDAQQWTTCDAPEVWQTFSQPVRTAQRGGPQGLWQSCLKVQGLHCSACAGTVQHALLSVPGVQAAQVDAVASRALVTWDYTHTRPSDWLAAVSAAGYTLLPIQGADMLEQSHRESRTMLWRWLVAALCMMQVMMYAWPNYSAQPGEMDALSSNLLRWASWLLTLPVLLFSCQPFFAGAWQALKRRRISMDVPVTVGIALTFAISTLAVWQPNGPWGSELYLDSLTMLVFFLLTGRWVESRLKRSVTGDLETAVAQLPLVVQRMDTNGQPQAVALHSIGLGDTVLVRLGESFAVDGVIVQGTTSADESLLTGESRPVAKQAGDHVVAGSVNLQAAVLVRTTQVGQDTRFAQIAALMANSGQDKPVIVQLADRIAAPFLWGVLALAAAAVMYWWSQDPHRAVLSAIAVLIVTCPCALALAAPAAFLSSAGALARAGLLTRKLPAFERMAQVTTVLFDKTGTLTLGELEVVQAEFASRTSAAQCWPVVAALTANSLHPVARALYAHSCQHTKNKDISLQGMSIREVVGKGIMASSTQGHTLHLGRAHFCGLPEDAQNKREYLCDEHGLVASFVLQETLRPQARQTLAALRRAMAKAGGSVQVLSGDQPTQLHRIAMQLDLPNTTAHARCTAQDKLAQLKTLQQSGHCVVMVGDGINDAPVLAAADVSIAPAQSASLAMVKSDFILTAQSLWPLAQLQRQATRTLRVVRQNLGWALVYNAVSVPLAWMGWLTPWMAGLGMALSSIAVLLNALRLQRLAT